MSIYHYQTNCFHSCVVDFAFNQFLIVALLSTLSNYTQSWYYYRTVSAIIAMNKERKNVVLSTLTEPNFVYISLRACPTPTPPPPPNPLPPPPPPNLYPQKYTMSFFNPLRAYNKLCPASLLKNDFGEVRSDFYSNTPL